jgi:hypothetical protein
MKPLISYILFFVFLNCACKKQPNTQTAQTLPIQESELVGEWVHSHEEDSSGFSAYRKKPYDFPPSRGRKSFVLVANHQLSYFDLSPSCGINGFKGTWSYQAGQLTLTFNDQILCYQIRPAATKIYLNKCL